MTSKEMLSFSAAKCEKALWRKVLRVVCEREDFAGPGASLGKAVLDVYYFEYPKTLMEKDLIICTTVSCRGHLFSYSLFC